MEVFTERLVLRPFTKADRDDVHVYASDPAVCFFTDWGPNSEADTDEFIGAAVATGAPLNTAVTLAHEVLGTSGPVPAGTVIGSVSAFGAQRGPVDGNPASRELGWVVRRDLWGLGIATEAVQGLIEALVADGVVREIEARCRPQNRASSRVMEHVGMTYVETIPQDKLIRGAWVDSHLYRLVITA